MSIQIEKAEPGVYWLVKNNQTIGSIQREYVAAHWSGKNLAKRAKGRYEWVVDVDGVVTVVNSLKSAKEMINVN